MLQTESSPAAAPVRQNDRLDLDLLAGPTSLPYIGPYIELIRFALDPVSVLDRLASGAYGNVVIFTRGMRRGLVWPPEKSPAAVFLFGPEFMQQVLTKHATYPESVIVKLPAEWGAAARLTGGLIWLEGDEHRKHRRLIVPHYHQRQIQGYRDFIVSLIDQALGQFELDRGVVLMDAIGKVLLAFQNQAVLGVAGAAGEMGRLAQRMASFYDLMTDPLVHLFPFDLPFTRRRRVANEAQRLSRDLDRLIDAKRELGSAASDVLGSIVNARDEAGAQLTQDELVAEAMQLFVAGWVPTRSAAAWTTFLLAQHPQVAADLHDELRSKLNGEAPTLEQLKELPMLDRVLKESLRLFPSIPFVARASHQAVEIGGYRIPPGTELHLSIYHAHRDPALYPQPNRFRPERWETLEPGPYAYLPFSIGSRTCPGMALATLQLKIFIAMLLQRYRLELPAGARVDAAGLGVMYPKGGLRLLVRKQDRRFELSRKPVRGNIHKLVDLSV